MGRKENSLPAAMPAIDFDSYRAKITVAGMVDNFAAKYAALDIPYPSDQGTLAAIDAQAAEQKAAVAKFTAESNARIEGIKADLAKWEAMKPVEEMNREEALEAGLVGTVITGMVDPKVPSFWPHNETWEAYKARLDATEMRSTKNSTRIEEIASYWSKHLVPQMHLELVTWCRVVDGYI